MIVVVRNPLSVIKEWTDHLATSKHGVEAPVDYSQNCPVWWDNSIKRITSQFADWHKIIMNDAKTFRIPVLYIKHEDLAIDPEPVLNQIMRFMLNINKLDGTNAEKRIM